MLTQILKATGFTRSRTVAGTTWVHCGSEGFWYPIRDGRVQTHERIARADFGNTWIYVENNTERDDAKTFKKLALRYR